MPNFCDNRVTINGPAEKITRIHEILEGEEPNLLGWMVPEPTDQGENFDWYNWRIENWGTKWEIFEAYIEDDDATEITFSFQTAWGPPVEAFHIWAREQGDIDFTLQYFEPGCAFVGTASYQDDLFDDDFVSDSTQPATYKEIAETEWGYEFEEEPEPLTEWYKQGVIDKGLTNE